MGRYARASLNILRANLAAVTFSVPNAGHAQELGSISAQPSAFGQFLDVLVTHQQILLSALIFVSIIGVGWGRFQKQLREWRKSKELSPDSKTPQLFVVLALIASFLSILSVALVAATGNKIIYATAGLTPPEPACKPDRPTATTAVVLIHGWNGNADATWTNFPRLFCEDQALSDSELYVVDYPTFLVRRQLSIAELGRWLRQSFFSDALRKYSDLHIVAHSMGGPMARSIYVQDVLGGDSKIRSIITIASPFLGAQVAWLANALGVSPNLTDDMKQQSNFLKTLANNWTDLRARPMTYWAPRTMVDFAA